MRLYPDMFTLTKQVQLTSDFAKNTLGRLTGEPPKFPDEEKKYDELKARIARTIDYVEELSGRGRIDATAEKDVTFPIGPEQTMTLKGARVSDRLSHCRTSIPRHHRLRHPASRRRRGAGRAGFSSAVEPRCPPSAGLRRGRHRGQIGDVRRQAGLGQQAVHLAAVVGLVVEQVDEQHEFRAAVRSRSRAPETRSGRLPAMRARDCRPNRSIVASKSVRARFRSSQRSCSDPDCGCRPRAAACRRSAHPDLVGPQQVIEGCVESNRRTRRGRACARHPTARRRPRWRLRFLPAL